METWSYKKIPEMCNGYSGLTTAMELYINPAGGNNGDPLLVTCDFTVSPVETQIFPSHQLDQESISVEESDTEYDITYELTMDQIASILHRSKVYVIQYKMYEIGSYYMYIIISYSNIRMAHYIFLSFVSVTYFAVTCKLFIYYYILYIIIYYYHIRV